MDGEWIIQGNEEGVKYAKVVEDGYVDEEEDSCSSSDSESSNDDEEEEEEEENATPQQDKILALAENLQQFRMVFQDEKTLMSFLRFCEAKPKMIGLRLKGQNQKKKKKMTMKKEQAKQIEVCLVGALPAASLRQVLWIVGIKPSKLNKRGLTKLAAVRKSKFDKRGGHHERSKQTGPRAVEMRETEDAEVWDAYDETNPLETETFPSETHPYHQFHPRHHHHHHHPHHHQHHPHHHQHHPHHHPGHHHHHPGHHHHHPFHPRHHGHHGGGPPHHGGGQLFGPPFGRGFGPVRARARGPGIGIGRGGRRGGRGGIKGRKMMARLVRVKSVGMTASPSEKLSNTWTVRNDSNQSWDQSGALVHIGGDNLETSTTVCESIGPLAPGQEAQVRVCDMEAPKLPGVYESFYRFQGADGSRWGQRLPFNVTVT